SPIAHASASTTLDLPEPFGPTTQVIPGSRRRVVAEANDLNPRSVRLFKYTRGSLSGCVRRVVETVVPKVPSVRPIRRLKEFRGVFTTPPPEPKPSRRRLCEG